MRKAIEKARASGLAFATVRNSNHYGIAAYYAMMALEHGLIGLSMTNSTHLAVPTFGRQKTQGTNPIAVAIPANGHAPYVLDMATTGVTFGRLEVSERKGKALKPGWAVDADGRETLDPATAMTKGALLPLGGYGTDNGGHKGYGLGALVEILCGVLSGGMFGTALRLDERGLHGGTVGHFFGAFRIDALRDRRCVPARSRARARRVRRQRAGARRRARADAGRARTREHRALPARRRADRSQSVGRHRRDGRAPGHREAGAVHRWLKRCACASTSSRSFVERALTAVGVDAAQARIVGDVLVAADRRGIESHGVARLRWFYVDRIRAGRIVGEPALRRRARDADVDAARRGQRAGPSGVASRDDARDREGARERHRVHGRAQLQPLRHRRLLRDDGIAARHDRHLHDRLRALRGADVRARQNAGHEPVRVRDPRRRRAGVRARLRDDDRDVRQAGSVRAQRLAAQAGLGRRRGR